MSMVKTLKIDHVTVAGSDLALMEQAFAGVGLATDYGGPHSNGITHMALLGFRDGSYIELISAMQPGQKDDLFWGDHIAGDGGPCAWAVQVEDVAAEAARVAALGVPVEGPTYYNRRRPDGTLVEWDLAILGEQGAGTKLPFIIKDITPRAWRVTPSAGIAEGPLTGVTTVVLAVRQLDESLNLFRRVYGWSAPVKTDTMFEAKLAAFKGTPVVLAEPLASDSWLARRLSRLGESPCAYLIGTDSFDTACEQFNVTKAGHWFDRAVAWFDRTELNNVRLAILDA